ncbi:uncharacterized protein FIBRA_06972 [Fibroporia radiculosa]|uniref:DUF6593 domain-containing protein n=1 Tax=Fibroporia radiculosa TaxID=599839 RepID=J4IBJ7_9APHY|nr:uncharacterized protein FIBRA_06972 [Fibroporia radiculosa]CCM04781.1 predicted protein [Fibroporia radiculosa]
MALTFSFESPLNYVILAHSSQGDPSPHYAVCSTSLFTKRTTTFSAISPPSVIAKIEWNSFSPDEITMDGRTRLLDEVIEKGGAFGRTIRKFTLPDGAKYKWKSCSSQSLVLLDTYGTTIARSHRTKCGSFWGVKRDMTLVIESPGLAFVDLIVLSFIVAEHTHRQRQEAARRRRRRGQGSIVMANTAAASF